MPIRHASAPSGRTPSSACSPTTKAITVVLVLRAIERGQLALTTPISEVVPEFSGRGREAITIFHLLTHSSGLPSVWSAREGMYIDRLDEVIAEICKNIYPDEPPGLQRQVRAARASCADGRGAAAHRSAKRSYRQIVNEDLLEPLGMKDTSIGVRKDLRERHLVPEFRGNSPTQHLGHSNLGPNGAFEEELAEMPWVGAVSTAADMYRFAEMLRRGGELDGARILSPTMVARARHCWTGDKPNELYRKIFEARGWEVLPAYIGLGFTLRGDRMGHALFGTLTSPRDVRPARRRHDDLLGRSRARHDFRRSRDGCHEFRREHRALAAPLRHRGVRGGVMADAFDFVVVGAGTAGCVLAARLSEDPRNSVCLLEAGGEDRHPFIHVPATVGAAIARPSLNWRFMTVPQPALDNRRIPLPRGRVIGGSGSINGMVYFRGQPRDFDDWAAMGNPGWSYREVLPYFIRSESNDSYADSPYHGQERTDQGEPHPAAQSDDPGVPGSDALARLQALRRLQWPGPRRLRAAAGNHPRRPTRFDRGGLPAPGARTQQSRGAHRLAGDAHRHRERPRGGRRGRARRAAAAAARAPRGRHLRRRRAITADPDAVRHRRRRSAARARHRGPAPPARRGRELPRPPGRRHSHGDEQQRVVRHLAARRTARRRGTCSSTRSFVAARWRATCSRPTPSCARRRTSTVRTCRSSSSRRGATRARFRFRSGTASR